MNDVCAQIARGVLGDEVVDAVHETRLSEKTISHIYTTLRQMLCDFMLQRNEHIHLGGRGVASPLASVHFPCHEVTSVKGASDLSVDDAS